VFGI
jgi:hypothetical protein